MSRPNWILILLFVFLYRMSDSYIAPMMYPFYDDMGFSKVEIASISKVFGVVATIVGALIGGAVVSRLGILKSLLFCGILQGLSNLVFVAQAYAGHSVPMLMLTISVENITSGLGTAAFVAYLSSLCNVAYTATQYALLSPCDAGARRFCGNVGIYGCGSELADVFYDYFGYGASGTAAFALYHQQGGQHRRDGDK